MLSEIDEALRTADTADAELHLKNAMAAGEEIEVRLAESAFNTEDHATLDEIEDALHLLRKFFQLGVEALSGDPDELKEKARLMKPLASGAADHIRGASEPLGLA